MWIACSGAIIKIHWTIYLFVPTHPHCLYYQTQPNFGQATIQPGMRTVVFYNDCYARGRDGKQPSWLFVPVVMCNLGSVNGQCVDQMTCFKWCMWPLQYNYRGVWDWEKLFPLYNYQSDHHSFNCCSAFLNRSKSSPLSFHWWKMNKAKVYIRPKLLKAVKIRKYKNTMDLWISWWDKQLSSFVAG